MYLISFSFYNNRIRFFSQIITNNNVKKYQLLFAPLHPHPINRNWTIKQNLRYTVLLFRPISKPQKKNEIVRNGCKYIYMYIIIW